MPTAEEFDEFYVSTRRRLVHQTFAVTGDLGASRAAVRDAYVAARHHWNKVGKLADPEQWVRPRAWSVAQRRHSARPWHKEKQLAPEHAELLEALHKLTDTQRKTLVLNHLASVPLADIGRELGETQEKTENHLQIATAALALSLDGDATSIRPRLESLATVTDDVKLPRPPVIRRSGLRRRRNHAVVGSVLAVLVMLGAGALVMPQETAPPPPRPAALVSKKMLLSPDQLDALRTKQPWTTTATSDNAHEQVIKTMCQTAAFADKRGLGTWVRSFSSPAPAQSLVQSVEISNSPGAAKKAYDTTLHWYAGCAVPRIQLVDTYAVHGIGDEATVLRMRVPGRQPSSYVVGITRTGSLTTSTVLQTATPSPADPGPLVATLGTSVQNLCSSRVAGACLGAVTTEATLPPPSGEAPGTLAIPDLPAIPGIPSGPADDSSWAGTDPVPATVNVTATTCDQTDFNQAGAKDPVIRSYLIPEANLPKRFGLSETIGGFASPQAAAGVVRKVVAKMKACPDKDLGSTVSHTVVRLKGAGGASYALWRLENQVNQQQELVPFWMGVVQVGRYVAQVNLTPVGKYDVDQSTFEALVVRAGERLHEVSQ